MELVEPTWVVPGGQAIGIILQTEGILITGEAGIKGQGSSPARQGGLRPGDLILAVEGKRIENDREFVELIDRLGREGKSVTLTVKRDNRLMHLQVKPLYCSDTGRYRLGILIRNTVAGVGTLTFYHREKNIFGALGHMVTDPGGRTALEIKGGQVVAAAIKGIQQGRKGWPGEKIGLFVEEGRFRGIIQKNRSFGIFGTISGEVPGLVSTPLPVALAEAVHPGPAELLTVVEGERVESFQVEIERVMPQQRSTGKGMVIKITDPAF